MEYMLMPLKRYAEFSGRSRRQEFWMFALLNLIVYCVLLGIMFAFGAGASMEDAASGNYAAMFGGFGLLLAVWALAVLIPSIAVSVRRLHDRDMSGWWYLGFIVASMIPIVGIIASIAYLVVMALPGTPGPNRFGPDPKGAADPEVFA
ncbi:MAG TPA: DUF805 domain-containing protein [Croceibacterium sp.]|nr:DUF805 domain-containing protein [Croceibacterium sp.]